MRWTLAFALAVLALPFTPLTNVHGATNYVDWALGDNTLDGSTNVVVPNTSHGPKRNIANAITAASNGAAIVIAPGYYAEFTWDPGANILTLLPQGQINICAYDLCEIDSIGDGIPDWWREQYFGSPNTTDSTSCAYCDPTGDGLFNIDKYQLGMNPNVGDPMTNGVVRLYNAFGIYTNSGHVYLQADARSTNAAVTVAAAEYFDTMVGVNGSGIAMTATDGVFNATNEVVAATLTPGYPTDQHHVYWLHALGSDGQWSSFVKVALNPNVAEVLNKVKANYAQFADLTYDVTNSYYVNGNLQQTPVVFHIQQKGAYMSRQTDPTTGYSTVLNYSRVASFDNNSQFQSGYDIGSVSNQMAGLVETNGAPYYWDIPGFLAGYPGATGSSVSSPAAGTVSYQATPADTNATSPVAIVVDMRRGVPIQETYQGPGGMTEQFQHSSPVEVAPGIWLPTSESFTTTFANGVSIQWQQTLGNIQRNTGLSDSLFTIPTVPQQ